MINRGSFPTPEISEPTLQGHRGSDWAMWILYEEPGKFNLSMFALDKGWGWLGSQGKNKHEPVCEGGAASNFSRKVSAPRCIAYSQLNLDSTYHFGVV